MDLMIRMLEHHVWLSGRSSTAPRGSTDDGSMRRSSSSVEGLDDDVTLRSLLSRLVGQLEMWNTAIENRAYDFGVEKDESLALDSPAAGDRGPGVPRTQCAR